MKKDETEFGAYEPDTERRAYTEEFVESAKRTAKVAPFDIEKAIEKSKTGVRAEMNVPLWAVGLAVLIVAAVVAMGGVVAFLLGKYS